MNSRIPKYDKATLGPCEEFIGKRHPDGYGLIQRSDGKTQRAHRAAYEEAFGPIPQGMYVCHKCDNPPCVRLDHLFLGTAKDNYYDALAKGRIKVDQKTIDRKTRIQALNRLRNAILRINRRRFIIKHCAKFGRISQNTIYALQKTTKHVRPVQLLKWSIQEARLTADRGKDEH